MAAYLTRNQFLLATSVPASYVQAIEAQYPGFVQTQLEMFSAMIDARLNKLYSVDPLNPALIVKLWLTQLVSFKLMERRGYNTVDNQAENYKADYDLALKDLQEAANAVDGLFDLPLKRDAETGGTKGAPMFYTETSPYVGRQVQREVGRREDQQGRGTTR